MEALVTGLSESRYFASGYDMTVGVNNCPFPVDHLVTCDHPRVFDTARLDVIRNHPGQLFTHIPTWAEYRPINRIELAPIRSDLNQLSGKMLYCHSISSPFVAVVHAFYQGATEIHLAGADLVGHHHLGKPENIAKCRQDFKRLHAELSRLGCYLSLIRATTNSAMIGVLPLAEGFETTKPDIAARPVA
jgi:hypothetical protein